MTRHLLFFEEGWELNSRFVKLCHCLVRLDDGNATTIGQAETPDERTDDSAQVTTAEVEI
jgi:hypothetical protein